MLNTQTQSRDLTGTLIADLVLQILSYMAESEREFIRKRQAEGITAAKERGVKFGPPQKSLPDGFDEARTAWQSGKISLRKAAGVLGISHMTFYRRCKDAKEKIRNRK